MSDPITLADALELLSAYFPGMDRAAGAIVLYHGWRVVSDLRACLSRIEANGIPVRIVEGEGDS